MNKIKYLIVFIILTSCSNEDLLNNEEKKYLLELTNSKDFILSRDNGSLRMEIYDSEIKSEEEQKLFSSIIIKEVSSIVDKKRTIKETNSNNTVLFINDKKKGNTYSLKNTILSQANKCYKSVDSLIKFVEINDKKKTKRFIDNNFLEKTQVNELIEKWFNVFDLDKKHTVNSYGFAKNKIKFNNEFCDIIEIYLQYDDVVKSKFLKLSFKSGLLIDLAKE